MTINNKIPIRCITVLLTGQQFIDLLPAVELLTDGLFHFYWFNKSRDIDVTMPVYNKAVKDWLLGQQQFCLTLERIGCPQPTASGNRSVLGSNKTAVVLEPSQ